jgi:hypothetical protein
MTVNGVDNEAMLDWKRGVSFVCDLYGKSRIPLLMREMCQIESGDHTVLHWG